MTTLVLRDVEVVGRRVDVVVRDDVVAEVVDAGTGCAAGDVVEGHGGAVIPGLWDHHLHLLALAASIDSAIVGPAHVGDADDLRRVLRSAAISTPGGWVRAVGYHESVAGELDRARLDAMVDDRPVRIQHRSGAQWSLNSAAVREVTSGGHDHPGLRRDREGRPTGVLMGADDWLRQRLGSAAPEVARNLVNVGARLAAHGVVGVTDAMPDDDLGAWDLLARAAESGALPQHIVVMGGAGLAGATPPSPIVLGPVKLYLRDHDLPGIDALTADIHAARRAGRTVAFHSVTRTSLVLAITALRAVGAVPGDRIEHGSVIPDELTTPLADMGVTIVTQPGFVTERGDAYLADVDAADLPYLYRCRSLIEQRVRVAGSTDAPYTDLDPWAAIRAAITRTTPQGAVLGPSEIVSPQQALDLFLGHPDDPGGPARTITPHARADLCVLAGPLADVLRDPSSDAVTATVISGRVVHRV